MLLAAQGLLGFAVAPRFVLEEHLLQGRFVQVRSLFRGLPALHRAHLFPVGAGPQPLKLVKFHLPQLSFLPQEPYLQTVHHRLDGYRYEWLQVMNWR